MRRGAILVSVFYLAASVLMGRCFAQQACPPPSIPVPDPNSDFFDARQEMDLGDAMAEHIERDFLVIDDEDLTGYLQRVGDKLLTHAPPTDMKVRFFLFDLPIANAVTLPGGRIYVSRKLVAFTRDENELASVLGHELGHALSHQPAIHFTRLYRDVLGVSQAGSREEIFSDYQQLLDNVAKKKKAFQRSGGGEQQEQLIADQIGMQLVAESGYSPQAFADFFDRLTQTKGKTGSWLSDLFGITTPESRRLRDILKQLPPLTASCSSSAQPSSLDEYRKWQASVINYTGLGHKERLHGVLVKSVLDPPLQSDVFQVRFSPDGNYLLAQNESTVFLMTREPFTTRFTIYAPDAYPAQFTSDSESVVFYTPGLRVETWSVADGVRSSASELVIQHGCQQTELSPDGKFLACYGTESDLSLYDVASGEQTFQKKNYYQPTFRDFLVLLFSKLLNDENPTILQMRFSPDSRYFLADSPDGNVLAIDLTDFHAFSLPGSLRKLLTRDFTFVGPDQIAGADPGSPKDSGLVHFPDGRLVKKFMLGSQRLDAAVNPRYLLLRPIKGYRVGILDLQSGNVILGSDKTSLDIFGETYARERSDGDLALFDLHDRHEISRIKLPVGQLGNLRASAISPDLRWLAISEKSRGGVYDLLHGSRIFFVRGFNGAWVTPEGTVIADFPKYEETQRQMGILNSANGQMEPGMQIGDSQISQFGSVLVRTTRKDKNSWTRNVVVEGLDPVSGNPLWSRAFPKEAPRIISYRGETDLVISLPANSDGAKLEIAANPALSQRWPKLDATSDDYFLESLDPRNGNVLGAVIVRTGKGSFRLRNAEAAGAWLVAADSSNRLLVYSLPTGERTGILFGRQPVISVASAVLAAQNERGQLSLYDLNTLARREEYVFTSPIVYTAFAGDHRRFLVLTGNQRAYTIQLPSPSAAPPQK